MGKSDTKINFRYYSMPKGEYVIPRIGKEWIREYGLGAEPYHFHNYLEIGICFWGEGTIDLKESGSVPFRAGNIEIMPPYFPHNTLSQPGKKAYWEWFFLDMENLLREIDSFREEHMDIATLLGIIYRKPRIIHRMNNEKLWWLLVNIRNEYEKKDYLYRESIHSMLHVLVFELLRIQKNDVSDAKIHSESMILKPALDYVEKNYDHVIRISELSGQCALSESHFRRIFISYMHITPNDYINLYRIRKACNLLQTDELAVGEIAERVGFANISTFNRNFQKMLGCTPNEWKKSDNNFKVHVTNMKINPIEGW